jgi:hypothetical protein
MADRTCSRCDIRFKYPSLLKRHKERKNPCKPPSSAPAKIAVEAAVGVIYHCRYCLQEFRHQPNRSRHERSRCHLRDLEAPANSMESKFARLEMEITMLKRQVALPIQPPQLPAATNVDHNTIDNRDQSRTVHTEVHFHGPVQINLHGKEDTAHLKEMLGQMLDSLPTKTDGKVVLTKVAKMIYADPAYPQNVTTYIPNKRDNIPHVWTASGWEPRTEAEVYPAMVNRACDELQLKQDFELGYTPDGLVQLGVRSGHVRAAFDAETEAKDLKEAAHMFRPMLQGNKLLLTTLV